MAKTYTKATDRRTLQRGASNLKRAGLIPANVDIRKMEFSRHYLALLNTFDNVAKGEAKGVRVRTSEAKEILQERGQNVVRKNRKDILIFPVSPNVPTQVRVLKDSTVKVTRTMRGADGKPVKVVQEVLPVRVNNIENFLDDLNNQSMQLPDDTRVFFTMFGHMSVATYGSIAEAVAVMRNYEAFQKAEEGTLKGDHMKALLTGIGISYTNMSDNAYRAARIKDATKNRSEAARRQFRISVKRRHGGK